MLPAIGEDEDPPANETRNSDNSSVVDFGPWSIVEHAKAEHPTALLKTWERAIYLTLFTRL